MLLVLSSLWGAPGGIPAFNRLLVRAAAEFAAAHGRTLKVIVLTDAVDGGPPAGWLAELPAAALRPDWYRGYGGSRGRCVRAVLAELPRRKTVVFGHVNLAPLGLLAPRYGVIAHGTEVWTALPRLRPAGCAAGDGGRLRERTHGAVSAAGPGCGGGAVRAADQCLSRAASRVGKSPAVSRVERGQVWEGRGGRFGCSASPGCNPAEPKGIDLMLRAVAELPEVEYTVVGTGAALPELQRLAARAGGDGTGALCRGIERCRARCRAAAL